MLLVIFGAGASYDSANRTLLDRAALPATPPPLAKDLVSHHFGHIAADLSASRPIIDRLRLRMGTEPAASLETELALLAEASATSPERRQQLVAFRFYLHRVIQDTITDWLRVTDGFTHYLTLLNRLFDWHKQTRKRIRLATFNYDELLDLAAQDVLTGWNFSSDLPAYVNRHEFQLFKLHGSTDWARVIQRSATINTPMVSASMDMAASVLQPGGTIVARPPSAHVGADGLVTLPAMAIPMAAKTNFECPPEHIFALQSSLPNVTHLLIIGWRAAEAHAVRLLEGSEPQQGLKPGYALGIVSGSEDGVEEVERNLGAVWRKGHLMFKETEGFSAFIARLDEHMENFSALPPV
jgi:hypothetical protein